MDPDPDPGGPKRSGSGGSGSGTLLYSVEIIRGCVSLKKRCKRLREFEEIEISRQSCTGRV
jgi:hypothetical protein